MEGYTLRVYRRDGDYGVYGRTEAENCLGARFKLIPPGEFTRGFGGERHIVTITEPFYIGLNPVTQREWREVMGTNPSYFRGDDLPVENVSWHDCQEFITALNAREGRNAYRLPTEAEWEYACKAGSDTGEAEHGWFNENYETGGTHPVGQSSPNRWGLYDMHGNVFEWCQDLFAQYDPKGCNDPKGPEKGSRRVVRGGSWDRSACRCSAEFRWCRTPGTRNYVVGLRLVMLPEPSLVVPLFYDPSIPEPVPYVPRPDPQRQTVKFEKKEDLVKFIRYLFCYPTSSESGLLQEAIVKDFLIRYYGYSGKEIDGALKEAYEIMGQKPNDLERLVVGILNHMQKHTKEFPEPESVMRVIRNIEVNGDFAKYGDIVIGDLESQVREIFLYSIHLSRSDAMFTLPDEWDLLSNEESKVWEAHPDHVCTMLDWRPCSGTE